MAKHVLHTSDDDLDFVLIGITCPLGQYEVVSLLDTTLKTRFFLSDYIPFNLKEGRIFKFSLYRFPDEELGLEYYLISNASNFEEPNTATGKANDLFAGIEVDESVRLVRELPRTDYFLILKGEELYNYQYRILDLLKSCPEILQVQAIEPEELPSRRNLIF